MVKIGKKEKSDQLYKAILQLKDEQECYEFFQDLCTVSELRAMEQRFEVASLLYDGMIYNDILERTGASSATISRVNRSLSYGTGATMYTADGPLSAGYTDAVAATINNTNLAQNAFGSVFGSNAGAMFVAVCLFFFAFSTILGWNLFGKINMIYLFGRKSVVVYMLVALVFIFLGTVTSSDLVWGLTDMFNQLMVIPNAIALFALTSMVVKAVKQGDEAKK